MSGFFIYSDQNQATAELINFAKSFNKGVYAITFAQEAADEIKTFGADKVFIIKGNSPIVENYGKAVAEFLRNQDAELFIVGASARGRDLAARVAGNLDCAMISDSSSLKYCDGKLLSKRRLFGGLVVQSELLDGLSVVTRRIRNFRTRQMKNSEIAVINVQADMRVSLLKSLPFEEEAADVLTSQTVVCVYTNFPCRWCIPNCKHLVSRCR